MAKPNQNKLNPPSRSSSARSIVSTPLQGGTGIESHHAVGTIAAITLIGTILRAQLLQSPVHADELDFFVHHYPRGWLFTVCVYYAANNHIAYNVMLQGLGWLFRPELWVARLPAFVCGCLLIPLTARVVRQIVGIRPAIYAAALIAVSPLFVNYSFYARGYSLFMLLIVASIGCIDQLLKRPSRRVAIRLGVLWALAAWTIPIAIHAVTFLLAWASFRIVRMPLSVRRESVRQLITACLVTGGLTLLLYAPVLLVTGWRSLVADPATAPRPLNLLSTHSIEQLGDLAWIYERDYGLIGSLIPILFAVAGVALARRRARQWISLAVAAVLCQLVWLGIQRVFPFPRALMPLLWVLAVLSAIGLAEIELRCRRVCLFWRARRVSSGGLAIVIVCSVVILFSRENAGINGSWPNDFQKIAQAVASGQQQQPRLFTNYSDVGINFYFMQLQVPMLINQFKGPGEYLFLCRKNTEGLDLVSRTPPGPDPVLEIWRSRGGPPLDASQLQQIGETRYYTLHRLTIP